MDQMDSNLRGMVLLIDKWRGAGRCEMFPSKHETSKNFLMDDRKRRARQLNKDLPNHSTKNCLEIVQPLSRALRRARLDPDRACQSRQ